MWTWVPVLLAELTMPCRMWCDPVGGAAKAADAFSLLKLHTSAPEF